MANSRPTLLIMNADGGGVSRLVGGIPRVVYPVDPFEDSMKEMLLISPKANDIYGPLAIKRLFTEAHGTTRVFEDNELVAMYSYCEPQASLENLFEIVSTHSIAASGSIPEAGISEELKSWLQPTDQYLVAWQRLQPKNDLSVNRSQRMMFFEKELELLVFIMTGPKAMSATGRESLRVRKDWKVWKRRVCSLNYLDDEAVSAPDQSVDIDAVPIAKKRRVGRHEAVPLAT